jgi:DNA-binding transcriptional ArsR family regulator
MKIERLTYRESSIYIDTVAKKIIRTDPKTFRQAGACLRILAHPIRLQLVELLLQDRFTVGELAEECELLPHVTSEHLRKLETCGLLTKQKDGRNTYYRSAQDCVGQIMDCIQRHFGS